MTFSKANERKFINKNQPFTFFYYFLIKTSEQKKLVSLPYYSRKRKERKNPGNSNEMKAKKNSCDSNRLWKSITNKKMRKKMFFHLKKAKSKRKIQNRKKFFFSLNWNLHNQKKNWIFKIENQTKNFFILLLNNEK